jgi:hypothetical protein
MKNLSHTLGVIGILLFALAVLGRFYSLPTITVMGHTFIASTFLLLSIAVMAIAIYVHLWSGEKE